MSTNKNPNNPANIQYRGKYYTIEDNSDDEESIQTNEWIKQQIEYAMKIGDWVTVDNRISNGLRWGWIKETVEGEM
jgi:hypothetical protein